MKIAYMKYNMQIERFDGRGKYFGGTQQRRGIFEQLAEQGHTIDIFSPVVKDFKQGYPYGQVYTEKYPTADEYDLLLIENGPTNLMFSMKTSEGSVPILLEIHRRIEAYEGIVFYLHLDPLLYMVLNLDRYTPTWHRISDGFGNERLLENREFHILTYAHNLDAFIDTQCNTVRSGYWLATGFHTVPPPRREWAMDITERPRHFLIYAGNERPRKKKFKHYFGHNLCSVRVIGKWKDKIKEELPKVHWMDPIPQDDVAEVLNRSVATVALVDVRFEESDCMTSRVFESIQSGCLVYADDCLKTTASVVGEEFAVSSPEELLSKCPTVLENKKRRRLLELQRYRAFELYDIFHAFGERFQEICEEVGL